MVARGIPDADFKISGFPHAVMPIAAYGKPSSSSHSATTQPIYDAFIFSRL